MSLQHIVVKLGQTSINITAANRVTLAAILLQQKVVKLAVILLQQKMIKLAVILLQQKLVLCITYMDTPSGRWPGIYFLRNTGTTPGRWQSKTPILSRDVDQKSLETVFFIAICHHIGNKRQSKTLFLSIFDLRSSIVDSVFDFRLPGVGTDHITPL